MSWLARLKKSEMPLEMGTTKPTKPGFVGFVGSVSASMQKTEDDSAAANDPAQAVGPMDKPPVAMVVATQIPFSSGALSMALSSEPAELPDPDRWCWPHSSAMTGREIDTMVERTSLFNRRGLPALQAELLADKLVTRDREADDRRLCLECAHLSRTGGAMRCAQWQRAGLGAPGIPAGLVLVLQRCDAFRDQTPRGAP